jgi:hypothetical protein
MPPPFPADISRTQITLSLRCCRTFQEMNGLKNRPLTTPRDRPIRRGQPSPSATVWLVLVTAFLIGLGVRQWAYNHTESIRFELNQQNAFYWGDRIVHHANPDPGPAGWNALWRSYVSTYADNEAHPAPLIDTLDYVPLRLLMAGVWVNYLNIAYGPVSQWRPEFARSFAAFSMVMELAGAIAMFVLVSRWLKRSDPAQSRGILPKSWGRWEQAAAAAILVWMNPASIIDSHIWPHGQTWILPFYLASMAAMIDRRYFLAGTIFGVGAMFKGQMLLVAPLLILWTLFDRRWIAAIRVAVGMVAGVAQVTWPWLVRGNMAWARAGFGANGIYSDVLRKGQALNLPALLAKHWNMTLHQRVIDQTIFGFHLAIQLRLLLIATYSVLLVGCAFGIARQARSRDPRLLVSIAAPWALMFFFLGQMDERYLVWSACFSAGSIAVNRKAIAAHLMLTWAGVATMLEFLLLCQPTAAPAVLHALIRLNPVTWLLTAAAVGILFFGSLVRKTNKLPSREFSQPIRRDDLATISPSPAIKFRPARAA